MSVERLVLGTAALGGNAYAGGHAINKEAACEIMWAAFRAGIRIVDTAPIYGEAEERIGYACQHDGNDIRVITKTTGEKNIAARSLHLLNGADSVEFFWHNYDMAPDGRHLPRWVTGATVYGPQGATKCWGRTRNIQVDWSILSQTEEGPVCLSKYAGEIIFARSIFLQGALAGATPRDSRLVPMIESAINVASYYRVNLPTLALRAALENDWIDYVVIGPQSRGNLDDLIEIAKMPKLNIAKEHLALLNEVGAECLDPRKWPA
jgi:aryl-alcohol dehydrogenase-like predicted oxidoreductase